MPQRALRRRNALLVLMLLVLAMGYLFLREHNEFRAYKTFIYERCQSRIPYDAAANAARQSDVDLYRKQIEIEQTNPFIDDSIRFKRVTAYSNAISAKLAANAKTPLASCKKLAP